LAKDVGQKDENQQPFRAPCHGGPRSFIFLSAMFLPLAWPSSEGGLLTEKWGTER
jgi:hypothetical protein